MLASGFGPARAAVHAAAPMVPLVAALGVGSAQLASEAARVLFSLVATHQEFRLAVQTAVAAGAVPALMGALAAHAGDADATREVVVLLDYLTASVRDGWTALTATGAAGVRTLREAVTRQSDNDDVLQYVLASLGSAMPKAGAEAGVEYDAFVAAALSEGFADVAVTALSHGRASVEWGAAAVVASVADRPEWHAALRTAGAPAALVELAARLEREYEGRAAYDVARALADLAAADSGDVTAAGGAAALTALVTRFAYDVHVVCCAASALAELSTGAAGCAALLAAGTPAALVACVSRHGDDGSLKEVVGRLLSNLAHFDAGDLAASLARSAAAAALAASLARSAAAAEAKAAAAADAAAAAVSAPATSWIRVARIAAGALLDRGYACPVCLKGLEEEGCVSLPLCAHALCSPCHGALQRLEGGGKSKCPVCRVSCVDSTVASVPVDECDRAAAPSAAERARVE
jgi:hypothetical protein